MLYQDHASQVDNNLHSQYLSDFHFKEIVKRIYITITPGNQEATSFPGLFSAESRAPILRGEKHWERG